MKAIATQVVGLIPARWASSRFPGKPLFELAGKPLLQHVWERCRGSRNLDAVWIATDDERIFRAAEAFGAQVLMTSSQHPTGTDRLAEAVAQLPTATHVVNIQGDEPLIDVDLIDAMARQLAEDPSLQMITAANVLTNEADIADANVVKVVLDVSGHALYFSRAAIPFLRQRPEGLALYRHKGIYGYSRTFLQQFVTWSPTYLEQAESLEQLRALEHGVRIRVLITDDCSTGLDVPEQVAGIESQLRELQARLKVD